MSSKFKRNFLIAAKGDENWYRALSDQELARRNVAPEDALFLPQALNGANILSAYDKFNLVSIAVGKSEGVKNDLVDALAEQVVKRYTELPALLGSLAEAEAEYRITNLGLEKQDEIFEDYGEQEAVRLITDLAFLRTLPDEDFSMGKQLPAIVANVKAGADMLETLQDTMKNADEKQKAVTAVLKQLDGNSVTRWASSYGFHYGDRFNEWDGPTREEAKVYFDIAKSLIKHWDEAGTSPNGKPYDAFAAGQNGSRFVFIKKDYVQKLKP